jgi:predicted transcriptional regulator
MSAGRNNISDFRPGNKGLEKFWGKLESQILDVVWTNGSMTVKRAAYLLNKKQRHAYTTVMTVMNRLSEKGILSRAKEGHSFVYSASMQRDEFLKFAAESIISGLMDDYPDITVRSFFKLHKRLKRKKTSGNPVGKR